MKNVIMWQNQVGGVVVLCFCNFVAVLSPAQGVVDFYLMIFITILFIYSHLWFFVCIF